MNGIERDSATSLPMVDLPLMVSSNSGHITSPGAGCDSGDTHQDAGP
jgi:hypothetical protein